MLHAWDIFAKLFSLESWTRLELKTLTKGGATSFPDVRVRLCCALTIDGEFPLNRLLAVS